jgi:hypothetical protein
LQKAAKRLASMLNKLHQCILNVFDHLEKYCFLYWLNLDRSPIIGVLENILPPLEFVCSTKGKDMVKALRRKLAVASVDEKFVEVEKESGNTRKFLYNLEFWLGKQIHGRLLGELTEKMPKVNPAWVLHSQYEVSEKEFLDYIVELAPQSLITEQLKRSLLLAYRENVQLRLVLWKYKFYAKGANNLNHGFLTSGLYL